MCPRVIDSTQRTCQERKACICEVLEPRRAIPARNSGKPRADFAHRGGEGTAGGFSVCTASFLAKFLWKRPDADAAGDQQSMKSLTEHLWFETPHRRDYLNITDTVEKLVRKSGVQEGLCLVNAMHITASVFINDAEDGLLQDYDDWLEYLAPHAPTSKYRHNRTGEDNADAHLKRQIMGREVVVAITKGKLDLGPWEQIFYGEFDGRRRKRVLVKIIGE
jgi:secondary thiamine-phosphate synthase enzyme